MVSSFALRMASALWYQRAIRSGTAARPGETRKSLFSRPIHRLQENGYGTRSTRSQGTQEYRLRGIHRRALDPIHRQHGAGARVQERDPADGRGSYERSFHAHLLRRLLLSLLYRPVQVRLFLPEVRLGRPALQPALSEYENPALVQALARDTAHAELRAAQPVARTRRRPGRERLVYGHLSRLLRVGVRRPRRAEGRESSPRTRISPTQATRCGGTSSRSPPSATATVIR